MAWKRRIRSSAVTPSIVRMYFSTNGPVSGFSRSPIDGDVSTAPPNPEFKSRAEILAAFDKNLATARGLIAAASDAQLIKPWSLIYKGQTIFTLPRMAVLRSFILNHTIHHRAQLGVYLRLNDIAVPSIYGPSADEGNM